MKVPLDRKRAIAVIVMMLFASSGLIPFSTVGAGNPDTTNPTRVSSVVVIPSSSQNAPSQGAGIVHASVPGGGGQLAGSSSGPETEPFATTSPGPTAGVPTGITVSTQQEGSIGVVTTSAPALFLQGYLRTYNTGGDAYASGLESYYPSTSPSITSAIPGLWLDASDKRRRTRAQIYVEILELVRGRGPLTPFEIAFYGRLNHKHTKQCMDFLTICGYLQPEEEEGKVAYGLTNEGVAFLERAKALFMGPQFVRVSEYDTQRGF